MIPSVRFFLTALMCASVLGGCVLDKQKFEEAKQPQDWYAVQGMNKEEQESFSKVSEAETLRAWWTLFNDPVLDKLVSSAMALSPDRAIALAKVNEARGIRQSVASSLFPQLNASANTSREDTGGNLPPDNYYDAGFDASYELDIFGRNRNAAKAAGLTIESLQAQFEDVTLTLIAEVARSYTEYRFFERQVSIAEKNLESERKTLDLIRKQNELGEATQLDVERAENQTNATSATIPDFKKQSDQARLRLSVLTGLLPEYVGQILQSKHPIPEADIKPVLASPALVLNARPDIKAARAAFAAQTKTVASETASLFPNITLSGLFGVQDSAFVSSASVWRVVAGAAVNLIDFGRIEGRINAAKAQEEQAYHMLRKTILEAVTDVEQAMQGYAHINEQRTALDASLRNAQKALDLSQQLYKEGEISFLDVLDAQRSVNQADLASSQAEYAQTVALISLYKSLGVY